MIREDIHPNTTAAIVKDGETVGYIARTTDSYFFSSDKMVLGSKAYRTFTNALEVPANKFNCKLAAFKIVVNVNS